MKDELQYWKDVAEHAVAGFEYMKEQVYQLSNEEDVKGQAIMAVAAGCQVSEAEISEILECNLDEAYAKHCEDNPPLHEYEVKFVVPSMQGCVRVKAKSEDEAMDYVESNIDHDICSQNVSMYRDEYVTQDCELDECDTCSSVEVEDAVDLGEYEGDE